MENFIFCAVSHYVSLSMSLSHSSSLYIRHKLDFIIIITFYSSTLFVTCVIAHFVMDKDIFFLIFVMIALARFIFSLLVLKENLQK